MERQKKVLDASVLVKWFSKEEDTDKALALLEQHSKEEIEILVPEIAFLEVINSLRYKKKDEEELQKALDLLLDIQLRTIVLTKDILRKSIKIAVNENLTIYDSLYAAIAQLYGCLLITADKELYGVPNVIPLGYI